MTIKSKSEKTSGIEIDLTGPEGNAFSLVAQARGLAEQLNLDFKAIVADMMSDDYEHLIAVFEEHFGEYVTLYR